MADQSSIVTVHTEQINYTLRQLKDDVDSNDIITNPDYQRKYVYDNKRASKLVESILIGIPIPMLYFCEEEDHVYSVIDGQQRIISFVRYLKNEYALDGLTNLSDLNGLYYRDLPKSTQRTLNSKTLPVIAILKDSSDLKYEIFSRLNLGAVKLRDQEVRNCVYRGSFNNMLKNIASTNETLKFLFKDVNNRSAYEERILRFFALRDYLHIKGTFKKQMNAFMEAHQNDEDVQITKYRNQYNMTIDTVKCILGENAFFSIGEKRKKFNGAVYDSIMIPFSLFPAKQLYAHADKIRSGIEELKANNIEYQNNIYVGTNAGPRVRGRIEQVIQIIKAALSNDPPLDTKRIFSADIKSKLFFSGCKCKFCGNTILDINDCEVDHIIPHSKGGMTVIENAQLLHKHCNKQKGDVIVSNFIDEVIDDLD